MNQKDDSVGAPVCRQDIGMRFLSLYFHFKLKGRECYGPRLCWLKAGVFTAV